ncbi:MAG TPA: beta-ketoacyl synthase chain length factor [Steroidobacteraceae bacterium]|nr:beta-ketoacyl synthase chain length factor [Steroidobacteraceae bacterium]
MKHTPAQPPPLTACIQGIGLIGPGLADWESSARVIAGAAAYSPQATAVPGPEGLPAAERRRTGTTVKLALAVARQAVAAAAVDPVNLPAVFSSSGGDGLICHEICETLASPDRQLSPTRFHNSVHNAAAGYWSLATGATAASTALCAYDGSFAAGLLEALAIVQTDRVAVLLCAYETTYPEPLRATRPLPDAFGVALVLTPAPTAITRAQLTVRSCATDTAADRLPDPGLEALRAAIPAARSLPLLRLLARREPGAVVLDYIGDQHLTVEVRECH